MCTSLLDFLLEFRRKITKENIFFIYFAKNTTTLAFYDIIKGGLSKYNNELLCIGWRLLIKKEGDYL